MKLHHLSTAEQLLYISLLTPKTLSGLGSAVADSGWKRWPLPKIWTCMRKMPSFSTLGVTENQAGGGKCHSLPKALVRKQCQFSRPWGVTIKTEQVEVMIAEERFRRRGLAREAVLMLMRYGRRGGSLVGIGNVRSCSHSGEVSLNGWNFPQKLLHGLPSMTC